MVVEKLADVGAPVHVAPVQHDDDVATQHAQQLAEKPGYRRLLEIVVNERAEMEA
jgi:hypothetical protein